MKELRAAMALVVALAAVGTVGTGQTPAPVSDRTTARTNTAGVSTERLTRIDAMLQSYVDRGLIPGAVALVLRDGRPVYQKAVGWADKEAGRPMRPDTLFRIASQTKAITSVAALTLVEDGQLGLSDQVGKYIPSFAKTTVAVTRGQCDVDRSGKTADHDSRPADAHRWHLVRRRCAHRQGVRGQRSRACRWRWLVFRGQEGTDLRRDGAPGHAAVRGAAGRGVGVRLQHRRAGLCDRARHGSEPRPGDCCARHRSAGDG